MIFVLYFIFDLYILYIFIMFGKYIFKILKIFYMIIPEKLMLILLLLMVFNYISNELRFYMIYNLYVLF